MVTMATQIYSNAFFNHIYVPYYNINAERRFHSVHSTPEISGVDLPYNNIKYRKY